MWHFAQRLACKSAVASYLKRSCTRISGSSSSYAASKSHRLASLLAASALQTASPRFVQFLNLQLRSCQSRSVTMRWKSRNQTREFCFLSGPRHPCCACSAGAREGIRVARSPQRIRVTCRGGAQRHSTRGQPRRTTVGSRSAEPRPAPKDAQPRRASSKPCRAPPNNRRRSRPAATTII